MRTLSIFAITYALTFALASCPGPKPPQPPAPTYKTVAIVLTQRLEEPATVYIDDVGGGSACTTKPGDGVTGYCEVRIRTTTNISYIKIQAKNYKSYEQDGINIGLKDIQIWIGDSYCQPNQAYNCLEQPALSLERVDLPRLIESGQFFKLEDGTPFLVKDVSMFNAYELYLEQNAALEDYIRERRALGFNTARVFLTYNNPISTGGLGRLVPSDYGAAFYTSLPDFLQIFARNGMYVNFVAFGDATTVYNNDAVLERQHAVILNQVLQGNTNVLLSWVNEADQPINSLPILGELGRVPGIPTSMGSNGSQTWPPQPYLDWLELHTNDASEEQRKIGHNCMEISPNLPCVTTEISRAPSKLNWARGGATFGFDSAAGCALLNAGCTFHSDKGKTLGTLAGLELDDARAWVGGLNSVPLACQPGAYRHRDDLETSGILRAYQRGVDPACIVKIRAN